jgi:hypothetical protein
VAVEVAVPRPDARARPLAVLRAAAAVPAWIWLTGIVVASFAGRLVASAGRVVPFYFPDEYIYPSLARGFAEHGRPIIRGAAAHFPALLEPIVTAPIWLVTKNPETAWRLTQGLHALLVSLAAVPAYLIARKVGLSPVLALAVGALAVAIPDTVYASSMLADPLAYPLVLAALCAGLQIIVDGSPRAQLAFVVFSALAVFTRIQYAAVPVAVLLGALAADRFSVTRTIGRVWPSLLLLGGSPALAFAVLGSHRVLGPYSHARHVFAPLSVLHWFARDAMLLAYSSGWVIVPGALVGLAYALVRPRTRAEIGFGVTLLVLALALLVEAAQIANTDSQRFQERYVFVLFPLLAVAFGLYVQRGLPRRLPVVLISAALLLLAARIPLSGYAAAHGLDDSPTLWAVLRVEGALETGNGALVVALVAGLLSGLATLVGWRRRGGVLALAVAIAACCALSAGAVSFDTKISDGVRHTLPSDMRWIDSAQLGAVDLIDPPGARPGQTLHALFWNLSAKRVLLLGSPAVDSFSNPRLLVAPDGRMSAAGKPLDRAFAVQTYGSTLQFSGVKRVRHELIWDLFRPAGIPRLQMLAAGRYIDGWLTYSGAFKVWTRTGGTLELTLSLPRTARVAHFKLGARTLLVHPGQHLSLSLTVPAHPWKLHYSVARPAYLTDRAVSVVANDVRFVPRR